ncbi:MAG: polysaccharide biosynthesis protein, partial [Pyrinomonadaceae bacterium]
LPITEALARRTLALPFHNNLADEQMDEVVTTLAHAVDQSQFSTMSARSKAI